MYAIRQQCSNGNYSMFIRRDGYLAERVTSAKLFATADEAIQFIPEWKLKFNVDNDPYRGKTEVVEVEMKQVASKVKVVVHTI